jgi:hypothetical protein
VTSPVTFPQSFLLRSLRHSCNGSYQRILVWATLAGPHTPLDELHGTREVVIHTGPLASTPYVGYVLDEQIVTLCL